MNISALVRGAWNCARVYIPTEPLREEPRRTGFRDSVSLSLIEARERRLSSLSTHTGEATMRKVSICILAVDADSCSLLFGRRPSFVEPTSDVNTPGSFCLARFTQRTTLSSPPLYEAATASGGLETSLKAHRDIRFRDGSRFQVDRVGFLVHRQAGIVCIFLSGMIVSCNSPRAPAVISQVDERRSLA